MKRGVLRSGVISASTFPDRCVTTYVLRARRAAEPHPLRRGQRKRQNPLPPPCPQLHPLLSLSNNLPSRYWVRRTDDELKLHRFGELSCLKRLDRIDYNLSTSPAARRRNVTVCQQKWCARSPPGREEGVAFAAIIIHKFTVKTLHSCPWDAASNAHRSLLSSSAGKTEPGAPGLAASMPEGRNT